MGIGLTLGIFTLTLVLIFTRPRGMHEAWATVLGGALMLLTRRETLKEAWQITAQGWDVLAFLFALMLLSGLLERSGFFEWAAVWAARWAKGDGKRLYRNVFLLGAAITALLSLDTTAIILTPIVLSFVRRLKLPSLPFLIACAFVANTASLLLPVSNLTNLLFQSAYHFPFGAFALRMLLPQIVVIALNYALFRVRFQRDLPASFDGDDLPDPASVIPDTPYFHGALWVLGGVTVGYFIGALLRIPPYIVALVGGLLLLIWGRHRGQVSLRAIPKDISWPLFPFVVGLFVVIRGVENIGLAQYAAQGLTALQKAPLLVQALGITFGAGIGTNIVNNIPMALLSISVLNEAHAASLLQYAALLGCNLGPNITVAGSLATMLVITSARKRGVSLGALDFFRLGIWTTPLLLIAGTVALWLISLLATKPA